HLALDILFQADLLLEIDLGDRAKALRRLVLLLAEIFLDRVAHGLRLGDRLRLALDPKPGLAAWRVANIPHASSAWLPVRVPVGTGIARPGCDGARRKIRSFKRVNSYLGSGVISYSW